MALAGWQAGVKHVLGDIPHAERLNPARRAGHAVHIAALHCLHRLGRRTANRHATEALDITAQRADDPDFPALDIGRRFDRLAAQKVERRRGVIGDKDSLVLGEVGLYKPDN